MNLIKPIPEIEKDEGANVARLTPAVIPSLTAQFANNPPEVTPTAGDTYTTNRSILASSP